MISQFIDDGDICHTLYGFCVGPHFSANEQKEADRFKEELTEAIFGENRDWGIFSIVWKFKNPCKEGCKICEANKGRFGRQEFVFSQRSNCIGKLLFTCTIGGCMTSKEPFKMDKYSVRKLFIKRVILMVKFNRREMIGSLAWLFALAPIFGMAKPSKKKTPKEFIEYIKTLDYNHPFKEFCCIELKENGPDYVEFPLDFLEPSMSKLAHKMETKTTYESIYGHQIIVTMPISDYLKININQSRDIEGDAQKFITGCLPPIRPFRESIDKYQSLRLACRNILYRPLKRNLQSSWFSCKRDTFFLVVKGDKYGFACLNKHDIIHGELPNVGA